jgi:apolipoprotein N-acyltransferase
LSAVLLALTLNLHPWWPLAWIAPVPLLLAAQYATPRETGWLALAASAFGLASNFTYYRIVSDSAPIAIALILAQGLGWAAILRATCRAWSGRSRWTAVFVYPAAFAALDTLLNAFSPHSSFGSMAYSQGDALAVLQIASITGTPGVVFILALFASTLAVALGRTEVDKPLLTYGLPTLCIVAALGFGFVRLAGRPDSETIQVGLIAMDDFIGGRVPPAAADAVWGHYEKLIHRAAGQGARLVVLPEKIEVLREADVDRRYQALSEAARRGQVYLAAGVGLREGGKLRNRLWLFGPDGSLASKYDKRHLVPGVEREFLAGAAFAAPRIDGIPMGLAICKDLHFPSFGRAFGQRGAAVVIDAAWDFQQDAWMAARLTAVRGIESGFAIVRSSREGLLTITDRFGRIQAETPSAARTGATLIATARFHRPEPTFYSAWGDIFGWLCVCYALYARFEPKPAGDSLPPQPSRLPGLPNIR